MVEIDYTIGNSVMEVLQKAHTIKDNASTFLLKGYKSTLWSEVSLWGKLKGSDCIDTALANFSAGEDLFKEVRKHLRKQGMSNLAEEIKDLRDERKAFLDEIGEDYLRPIKSDDGTWQGEIADLHGYIDGDTFRVCIDDEFPNNIVHTFINTSYDEEGLASWVNTLSLRCERYKDLIEAEMKFIDTALNDLRGWKSATGADIAELKPEIVRGANAAETMLGKLSAFLAALPDRFKRAVGRMSKSKDPLYKSCDEAVFEAWQKFKDGESDPEMPDGTWRQKGGKRGVKEFLAVYGNKKIYNGQTLNEICKSNIDELGKIIGRKNKQRQRAKANAKK